jgi:hypothetical protein
MNVVTPLRARADGDRPAEAVRYVAAPPSAVYAALRAAPGLEELVGRGTEVLSEEPPVRVVAVRNRRGQARELVEVDVARRAEATRLRVAELRVGRDGKPRRWGRLRGARARVRLRRRLRRFGGIVVEQGAPSAAPLRSPAAADRPGDVTVPPAPLRTARAQGYPV